MNMLCPECLRELQALPGGKVRCPSQGTEFRVLFARGSVPYAAPPAVTAPGVAAAGFAADGEAVCRFHPSVPAVCRCGHCGAAICETCRFGGDLCPQCAESGMNVAPPWAVPVPAASALPEGTMCRTHTGVPAVQRCQVCHAPVCATCDFAYPGNIHLCPRCATDTRSTLSAKRKQLVSWSIALAILSTLSTIALVLAVSGALGGFSDEAGLEAMDVILSNAARIMTLIGTALGIAALDKRLGNPGVIWVSVIWNGVLLLLWLFLIVLGLLAGG
jgi:hypothetical protein